MKKHDYIKFKLDNSILKIGAEGHFLGYHATSNTYFYFLFHHGGIPISQVNEIEDTRIKLLLIDNGFFDSSGALRIQRKLWVMVNADSRKNAIVYELEVLEKENKLKAIIKYYPEENSSAIRPNEKNGVLMNLNTQPKATDT